MLIARKMTLQGDCVRLLRNENTGIEEVLVHERYIYVQPTL